MKWVVLLALLALGTLVWMVFNPVKGFGLCRQGLTTYDLMPIPFADFQVRADGSVHLVAKTVDLTLDEAARALDPKPDVFIVATGWKGALRPRPEVVNFLQGYDVRVLPTGEAVDLYNKLIDEGKRVAIHVRSSD